MADDLKATLESLAAETGGRYGAAYRELATGRELAWQADEPFPSASVIKVPIMAEVYRRGHEGTLRLSDTIELLAEDVVGGSGVLQLLTPGVRLSVRDLVELMICASDNTATNMLLAQTGIDPVNRFMEQLGLRHTRVHNKLQVMPVPPTPLNQTSPRDMVELMSLTARGQVVSRWACDRMIATMKRQQYNDLIPARLPVRSAGVVGARPSVEVAHKTGWFPGVRGDAGLVYAGDRCIAMAIMARDIPDDTPKAIDVIARMARALFDAAMEETAWR